MADEDNGRYQPVGKVEAPRVDMSKLMGVQTKPTKKGVRRVKRLDNPPSKTRLQLAWQLVYRTPSLRDVREIQQRQRRLSSDAVSAAEDEQVSFYSSCEDLRDVDDAVYQVMYDHFIYSPKMTKRAAIDFWGDVAFDVEDSGWLLVLGAVTVMGITLWFTEWLNQIVIFDLRASVWLFWGAPIVSATLYASARLVGWWIDNFDIRREGNSEQKMFEYLDRRHWSGVRVTGVDTSSLDEPSREEFDLPRQGAL